MGCLCLEQSKTLCCLYEAVMPKNTPASVDDCQLLELAYGKSMTICINARPCSPTRCNTTQLDEDVLHSCHRVALTWL